jgi:hypothetical protein
MKLKPQTKKRHPQPYVQHRSAQLGLKVEAACEARREIEVIIETGRFRGHPAELRSVEIASVKGYVEICRNVYLVL